MTVAEQEGQRMRALEAAIAQIERQHGKGAIMRMGETQTEHVDVIPTGSLALDLALGVGGVPRGRIVEIFGPESSGKTTLALHIMAEAQKGGGIAAFIDAEHAQDPRYARRLGVDVDNLLISQPDTAEQALEIAEALVRSEAVDVIVVDSVAALAPRAEIEGEMGDAHVGLQARLMSQALRKLTAAIARSRCVVVFTNQLREKVGVMFGNPETTPGGRALKFYASIRMDIRRVEVLKQGPDTVGMRAKVKVVKNKLAPPFREAEFDILYGTGICHELDVLDVAVSMGLVQKSGPWYAYGDTRLGQGRDQAREFLRQNPLMVAELEDRCREQAGLPPLAVPRLKARMAQAAAGSGSRGQEEAAPGVAAERAGGEGSGASAAARRARAERAPAQAGPVPR